MLNIQQELEKLLLDDNNEEEDDAVLMINNINIEWSEVIHNLITPKSISLISLILLISFASLVSSSFLFTLVASLVSSCLNKFKKKKSKYLFLPKV